VTNVNWTWRLSRHTSLIGMTIFNAHSATGHTTSLSFVSYVRCTRIREGIIWRHDVRVERTLRTSVKHANLLFTKHGLTTNYVILTIQWKPSSLTRDSKSFWSGGGSSLPRFYLSRMQGNIGTNGNTLNWYAIELQEIYDWRRTIR